MPFSWADLRAHATTVAGETSGGLALHLAKSIFGDAWQTLYAGGDPLLDDVVPAQVVHLLYRQLGRLTLPSAPSDAMDTQAAEAFAAIEAGTKRTRTA